MSEPVRLVIWDLDETFWRGTLTEGGIREYVWENHDLIIELAQRGIVSSICSKNDPEAVKAILEDKGLWNYFVLPSISWEAKGSRIAVLIEALQLRAPTVMFIDDNPINLQEAKHLVPGLQTESHEFIPHILDSPLFSGKDDRLLTRLNQYKTLEKRKSDEAASPGAVEEFLRKSNIRVRFDYNILGNINRAVELINRTNQLNFTKVRLPEGTMAAAAALASDLASHELRAALVGVRDNYGDHGWCGIYVLHTNGTLKQFAFSCRILGMDVETWLYRRLNSPRLAIAGEVLTDVKRRGSEIDWITVESDYSKAETGTQGFAVDRIVARGGCDLMSVTHYLSMVAPKVIGEFNENRFGMDARLDHSTFISAALSGQLVAIPDAVIRLGYELRDFSTNLLSGTAEREVWLLSFWTDAAYTLYKHRVSGLVVPFSLGGYQTKDARLAVIDNQQAGQELDWINGALQVLKEEFDYIGFILEADYKRTLHELFTRGVSCRAIFVVAANEYFVSDDGVGRIMARTQQQNKWLLDVARHYGNVTVLNIRDFVRLESEVHDQYHFDRLVYYRLYEAVRDLIGGSALPADYRNWAIHQRTELEAELNSNLSAHEMTRVATFLLKESCPGLALKFAEQAVRLDPSSLTHRLPLVDARLATGVKLSLEDVADILNSPKISADIMRHIGMQLMAANLLDVAEVMLRGAVTAEPTEMHNRHGLANALDRQGKKLEALDLLQSCLRDGDVNPHVRAHVGRLLLSFGHTKELEQNLLGWMQDDPSFAPYEALKRTIDLEQLSA